MGSVSLNSLILLEIIVPVFQQVYLQSGTLFPCPECSGISSIFCCITQRCLSFYLCGTWHTHANLYFTCLLLITKILLINPTSGQFYLSLQEPDKERKQKKY